MLNVALSVKSLILVLGYGHNLSQCQSILSKIQVQWSNYINRKINSVTQKDHFAGAGFWVLNLGLKIKENYNSSTCNLILVSVHIVLIYKWILHLLSNL